MKMTIFQQRRQRLLEQLPVDSMAIIAAAPVANRSMDVDYAYRQHSNFYYLTGFAEPEAVAVFIPNRPQGEYILFSQSNDAKIERWSGRIIGQASALRDYGVDQASAIEDIDDEIIELLCHKQRIYYPLTDDASLSAVIMDWLQRLQAQTRKGETLPTEFVDINPLIHESRLFKSPQEIVAMRRAIAISTEAHKQAMRRVEPGCYEYQLQAELEYVFRQHASPAAYEPIVAGGDNANILHYVTNDQALQDGDLVLIDAGAEYDYYAADITRTFPVNGQFNDAQRQLYQRVLDTQLAVIAQVKPGVTIAQLQQLTCELLSQHLLDLGLLTGKLEDILRDKHYSPFYMHGVSHWLGMDVHDAGNYKIDDQWRPLAAGMVITVEPGLYIEKSNKKVAKQWRGIGIRIEDDVLVTKEGCDVLSQDLPKTIAAIEELMR